MYGYALGTVLFRDMKITRRSVYIAAAYRYELYDLDLARLLLATAEEKLCRDGRRDFVPDIVGGNRIERCV